MRYTKMDYIATDDMEFLYMELGYMEMSNVK